MQTFQTEFERILTADDRKQNLPFPVNVPEGTTQFTIRLTYTPPLVEDIHNLLTLTVFDPSGWRGAGHRHGGEQVVVISAAGASPGFRPGPIPAGEWTVVVDVHMVMMGPPCQMRLEVVGSDEVRPESFAQPLPAVVTEAKPVIARGPGWYRGDLHAHTIHSDAIWDIDGLVGFARVHGLDFTTLTDHNTVSGLAQMDAASTGDLLTMGGMELTTFWGHALALGLREWVDWRVREGERSMEQIEREVTNRGGLFIIAHPKEIGDPYCTGCDWRYLMMMPGTARAVEVWNGAWGSDSMNEQALHLVFDWLNQGFRLALTAGTDNHGRGDAHYGFNNVFASELSEPAVLNAVRVGHLYLSAGPELGLEAAAAGQHAMLGDVLDARTGGQVQVSGRWAEAPAGARLEFIVDGQTRETLRAAGQGSQVWLLDGAQAHWCLLTLRSADSSMLALTNPIFLDGRG